MPTTTLFTNARFFTSSKDDAEAQFAECMLVRDSVIVHVGARSAPAVAAAQAELGSALEERDLAGRAVLPGFFDGHLHILLMGQALQKIGLESCRSVADIRALITEYARAHPDVPRIQCRGWMNYMTDDTWPDKSMLEGLDPLHDRPIYVASKDLHNSWCNEAAMRELDLEDKPDPNGGTIHRDADGRTTGIVAEAACVFYVWPFLAKAASLPDRVHAVKLAITALSKAGYTGFVDMAMDDIIWEALLALREQEGGKLPVRVAAYWFMNPDLTDAQKLAQVDRAIALSQTYSTATSPDLRVVGIKVMCDGIIDACTASLFEPYSTLQSPPPATVWSSAQLEPLIARASEAGLQVALHAIGDAAIAMAIAALSTSATPHLRHRIEHLELTRPGDGARLAAAHITASVQPVHADPAVLRAWPRLLGAERCTRAFAYADFARAGAPLALGSDAPTAPCDALQNMYVAVTRRSAREPASEEVVNPQWALSMCEAVGGATRGSAYSVFLEDVTGSLEVGKSADFAVVDMRWEAERLLEARVEETWFEGRRVYCAAEEVVV